MNPCRPPGIGWWVIRFQKLKVTHGGLAADQKVIVIIGGQGTAQSDYGLAVE